MLNSAPSRAASPPLRGGLLGSEIPRVFTPPLRKLTPRTSLGFAVIEFASSILRIELLPWQQWLLIHALELRADGTFRFRTVLLLVARQNGKTMVMQVLALFAMYVRGVGLVLGSAQRLDIAEEVWASTLEMAQGVEELAVEIAKVDLTNGKKAFRLFSGERYKVQASNRRGGRSLSGDLVLLDELREHQKWDAWAAITKTTMARPFAQIWGASNAGDLSSVVLAYLRLIAHLAVGNPDGLSTAGVSLPPEDDDEGADSLGIFEWSAPPHCLVGDRTGWAAANPSLGHLITERAVASAMRTDPEDVFRMEVLCQFLARTTDGVISSGAWDALAVAGSAAVGPLRFAVDSDQDQKWASIGFAGRTANGGEHVEILDHRQGLGWIVPRLKLARDRAALDGVVLRQVVLDPSTPAGSLIAGLVSEGFDVVRVKPRELAAASSSFLTATLGSDGVEDRVRVNPTISHRGQESLDSAIDAARTRPLGDGWTWARKTSLVSVSPLRAVTLARWALLGSEGDDYNIADSIY